MIYVNCIKVDLDHFGDKTLKCVLDKDYYNLIDRDQVQILWAYDNDEELFALYAITRHIQDNYCKKVKLIMPYIPNARQDREVSDRIFTLKYFAEIINSLNFVSVYVLDPHSGVATNLINNIVIDNIDEELIPIIEDAYLMFPDNGAAVKYFNSTRGWIMDYYARKEQIITGTKHRNADGRIDSYELTNFKDGIKTVIIRDDICSYGGTFVSAAKELRKRGVENIILVVSHCENNILKGEVFDYFDEVYTTDSICTIKHPKLTIIDEYRI